MGNRDTKALENPPPCDVGPFSPRLSEWHDFWLQTNPYLPSLTLYQLSCTSKLLNSLVWTHLIPASPHGLNFSKAQSPTLSFGRGMCSDYFSRVPSLKHLDLSQTTNTIDLLTKIIHLNSLVLPHVPMDEKINRFQHFSHLTSITCLTSCHPVRWSDGIIFVLIKQTPTPSRPIPPPLQFPHLRHLSFHFLQEHHILLNLLTQLETLKLDNYDGDGFRPRLTNLRELSVRRTIPTRTEHPDIELSGFTNLTKLRLSLLAPKDLKNATNLTSLKLFHHFQILEDQELQDLTKFLTKLKKLELLNQCGTTGVKSPDFSPLVCLEKLFTMASVLYHPALGTIASLPLKTLHIKGIFDYPRNCFNDLCQFTTLEHLICDLRPSEQIKQLTKLKTLQFRLNNQDIKHLPALVGLTDLKALTLAQTDYKMDWKAPEVLSLTNLTSFSVLLGSAGCPADDTIQHMRVLTGLVHLGIPEYSRLSGIGIRCLANKYTNLRSLDLRQHPKYGKKEEKSFYEPLYSLTRLQKVSMIQLGKMYKLLEKELP